MFHRKKGHWKTKYTLYACNFRNDVIEHGETTWDLLLLFITKYDYFYLKSIPGEVYRWVTNYIAQLLLPAKQYQLIYGIDQVRVVVKMRDERST